MVHLLRSPSAPIRRRNSLRSQMWKLLLTSLPFKWSQGSLIYRIIHWLCRGVPVVLSINFIRSAILVAERGEDEFNHVLITINNTLSSANYMKVKFLWNKCSIFGESSIAWDTSLSGFEGWSQQDSICFQDLLDPISFGQGAVQRVMRRIKFCAG